MADINKKTHIAKEEPKQIPTNTRHGQQGHDGKTNSSHRNSDTSLVNCCQDPAYALDIIGSCSQILSHLILCLIELFIYFFSHCGKLPQLW